MGFGKTIPILRLFDQAKAKEFYVNFLGFNVDWKNLFEPDLPALYADFKGRMRPPIIRPPRRLLSWRSDED